MEIKIILIFAVLICIYLVTAIVWRNDGKVINGVSVSFGFGLAAGVFFAYFLCNISAFLLALCGIYKLQNVCIVVLAVDVFLFIKLHKKGLKLEIWKGMKSLNKCLLLLVLVSAFIYCFFPTKYLWGRRDPALYIINGVHIAESGSISYEENELLNEHYDEWSSFIDLEYAGIYSDYKWEKASEPSAITSQFLHMFPAVLAVGYSFGGLEGLFRVNGIIGILCILGAYYYVKYFVSDKKGAIIAAMLFALNPAQIWNARITQTELLYQLWLLVGLFLFSYGWLYKRIWAMVVSGAVIGFIGLNRIDSYICGAGIFAVACYCNIFIKNKMRYGMGVLLGYTLASALSFWYAYSFSFYYVYDHWKAGVLKALIYLNIILFFGGLVTFLIGKFVLRKEMKYNPFATMFDNSNIRLGFFALVGIGLTVLYYIRPLFQNGSNLDWDFSQRSFVEFCWYTSIIAVGMAMIGMWKIASAKEKRRWLLLYIAIGCSSMIIYIYQPSISPDHIWASRRWVSACFPFVFIAAAYGIVQLPCILKGYYTRYAPVAVTISIIAFFAFQSRMFIFTPLLNEFPQQYEYIAGKLEDKQPYFTSNRYIASILRFVYEKNVFLLKEGKSLEMAKYMHESGDSIKLLGNAKGLNANVLARKVFDGEIKGSYLEEVRGAYSRKLVSYQTEADLYELWPKGTNAKEFLTYSPEWHTMSMDSMSGNKNEMGEFVSEGKGGYFAYGPYASFSSGRYLVAFTIDGYGDKDNWGTCDVSVNEGTTIIASSSIEKDDFLNGNKRIVIAFDLKEDVNDLEFRVSGIEGVNLTVTDLSYRSLDSLDVAICDSEMVSVIKGYSFDNEISAITYFDSKPNNCYVEALSEQLLMPVNIQNSQYEEKSDLTEIILCRYDNANWHSLLDDYVLVGKSEDYLLFVSDQLEHSDEILSMTKSNGREIPIAFFYDVIESGYNIDSLSIAAGEYLLDLVLEKPQNKAKVETDDQIIVKVYSGNQFIEEFLHSYKNRIQVPLTLYGTIKNVNFQIVTSDGRLIDCKPQSIQQIKSYSQLFAERYLDSLLEQLDRATTGKVVFIDEAEANREIFVKKYLQNNSKNNIQYRVCHFDHEQWDPDLADTIILPNRLDVIFDALKKGYQVIEKNEKFVLLNNTVVEGNYSKGDYLNKEYFKNYFDHKETVEKINLPEGIYEIKVEVNVQAPATNNNNFGSVIVYSGSTKIAEQNITSKGKYDISIPVSGQDGLPDVSIKIVENRIGSITGEFWGVGKISDGYRINLNQMGVINAYFDGLYVKSKPNAASTIYGPYFDLEEGDYEVTFIYETGGMQNVTFDVVSELGNEIHAQYNAIYSDLQGKVQEERVTLNFSLSKKANNVEFRTQIAPGSMILLKDIILLKK